MGPVQVLSPELVLVDWGPMTLTIGAWRRGRALPVAAAGAARAALHSLARLSDFQNLLRRSADRMPEAVRDEVMDEAAPAESAACNGPAVQLACRYNMVLRERIASQARAGSPGQSGGPSRRPRLPEVVGRAVKAALVVGGGLTPLAAVAGAAADQVAQAALGLGADRVIVNNGGDIALAGPDRIRVGLRPPKGEDGAEPELAGVLNVLPGDGVGGVATSGWQGRSFSPGVADLVTCWAADAATADAAATLVAGRATVRSPVVRSAPARELNPESDLGDLAVTRRVGRLNQAERLAALQAGLEAARELHSQGRILGCLIRVQGETAVLDPAGRLEWRGGQGGERERAVAS